MNSNLETRNYKLKTIGGFSIVELLVMAAIIAVLSSVLLLTFRKDSISASARQNTALVIMSDIRRAQSLAVSGSRYQNNLVCGFGAHYINKTSYLLYAKALPVGPCSSVATRNYQSGSDYIVETRRIIYTSMEIRSSFDDIFYESPDPKTYINNYPDLTGPKSNAGISIQLVGQSNCGGGSCTTLTIYTSGRIDFN